MTTLTAALEYLALGWSVIPCEANGKKALVEWTDFQKVRPTEKQIKEWWSQYPNANIAVITGSISSLVCVDVDTYKGGSPDGLPYSGVRARSARGGLHFFYKYPENTERVKTYANAETHIDVRGDGGYVVIAPSTIDGKAYEFLEFDGLQGLGTAPGWVREDADNDKGRDSDKAGRGDRRQSSWLSDLFEGGLREGARNDTLSRLAGYLYEKRIPRDVAVSIASNLDRNSLSPLGHKEVSQTVLSVYKTAKNRNASKSDADTTDADGKRKRFELLRAVDYARKHGELETKWCVENWLPSKTVAFVVAPPETYKTWLLFELAICIAGGFPFLGQEVTEKGPVIIIQQEDFAGQNVQRLRLIYANKVEKASHALDGQNFKWDAPVLDDLPIYFHEDNLLRFDNEGVMNDLEALIVEIGAKVVMVDPLYSAADQTNYMADAIQDMMRAKDMRNKHGVTWVLAHHTKKGAEANSREGLWGSQFLNAFLETGWQLRRVNEEVDNKITITRHFKSAARPPMINIEFQIQTKDGGYEYSSTPSEYKKEDPEDTNVKNASDAVLEHYEKTKSEGETVATLAGHLDMAEGRIRKALTRLQDLGRMEKTSNGVYLYKDSKLHE